MRSLLAVTALMGAVLLSACASEPAPPEAPSAAEVTAYNQNLLDLTYAAEKLDGVATPLETSTDPLPPQEWIDALSECTTDADIPGAAFSWGSDGYFLQLETPPNDRERAAFYGCVALHPRDPVASGELLSDAQLRYLWQYYSRWLVPCLRANDEKVTVEVPTQQQFLAHRPGDLLWSPYSSLERTQPRGYLFSLARASGQYIDPQTTRLMSTCGLPFGLLGGANP